MMLLTGFFALHTSHTFTVRKSRVTRYLALGVKSAEEQQEIISVRKFFWPGDQFLKLRAVLSVLAERRMSQSLSVPLFVPYAKRLSEEGCMRLKVIFSFTSSIFSPRMRSATRKGLSGFSKLQRKACTSSLESRYCQLLEVAMELMEERCLGLKVHCSCEMQDVSTPCSLGMARSFPADFTTFLSVFSKIFHSLMVRSLVVSIFMQAPWWLSQAISRTSSSMSMLRSGSNSRVCDWNSEKYSQSSLRLLLSGHQKIMTRPALSPSASIRPLLSNFIAEMISSSRIFSFGPLYPNNCPNLQLLPLLETDFSILPFLLSLLFYQQQRKLGPIYCHPSLPSPMPYPKPPYTSSPRPCCELQEQALLEETKQIWKEIARKRLINFYWVRVIRIQVVQLMKNAGKQWNIMAAVPIFDPSGTAVQTRSLSFSSARTRISPGFGFSTYRSIPRSLLPWAGSSV